MLSSQELIDYLTFKNINIERSDSEETYITLDILYQCLKNFKRHEFDKEDIQNYLSPITDVLMYDRMIYQPIYPEDTTQVMDEYEIWTYIIYALEGTLMDFDLHAPEVFHYMIEEIDRFHHNHQVPLHLGDYTRLEKMRYISRHIDDVNYIEQEERELYKLFVEELLTNHEIPALEAVAWGCYGGNKVFECDWKTSEYALSELLDLTDDGVYANALGYIYYYGRLGRRNYKKAFEYFSIASAQGNTEAQYKIADMYKHGYGVRKNERCYTDTIQRLYYETLREVVNGSFVNKYPDVALRMGDIYENGYGLDLNPEEAIIYYSKAEFIMRNKMQRTDFYGDESVYRKICENIQRCEETYPTLSHHYETLEELFDDIEFHHPIQTCTVEKIDSTTYYLHFEMMPLEDGYYYKYFVGKHPDFVGFSDTITVMVEDVHYCDIDDGVIFDRIIDNVLLHYGEDVGYIDGGDFEFVENPLETEIHEFANILLDNREGIIELLCDDIDIDEDDRVIIHFDDGDKYGTVVYVFESDFSNMLRHSSQYKIGLEKLSVN